MVNQADFQNIFDQPLEQLRIATRLRRRLLNNGYKTLREAISSDQSDLEELLGFDLYDEWLRLLRSAKSNPAEFAANLLQSPNEKEIAETKKRIQFHRDDAIRNDNSTTSNQYRRTASEAKAETPIPDKPFSIVLNDIENKSKRALSELADHSDSAIIAESFPALIEELDDLKTSFKDLFDFYSAKPSRALDIARLHFSNAYLVFVAFFASENFDGEALWKNLYEYLSITNQSAQNEMKAYFYKGITDRGLPHFTAKDNDFHYLYTALLHGGFSKTFWEPVWEDILLPYAKRESSSWLSKRNSFDLLNHIRNDDTEYNLGRAFARRIIEKAPVALLEPLLDPALQVAIEMIENESSTGDRGSSFEMLTSHGLPDSAMQALRGILEKKGSRSGRRLVYLPTAELRLNPSAGQVHLHWDAQKFPMHFAGKSVEYLVNGSLERTVAFTMGVGKCLLPEVEITLKANDRFDIELILVDSDEDKTKLTRLRQTFDRTRPGAFEFVEGSDGIFRLRRKRERITRKKRVAFLIKAGLRVVPGFGMEPIGSYEADSGFAGASIQTFNVLPGSSGMIESRATGEIIASWTENYRVEIDRSRVIGKGPSNSDLYGFSYTSEGGNAQLPDVYIETNDISSVREDLEILCFCDGERRSLPWNIEQDIVDYVEQESGRLVIRASEAMMIPRFVKEGLIEVLQKSSQQKIFTYKFSIIPARAFGISELIWNGCEIWATYTFEAMDPITVPSEDGDYEMLNGDVYFLEAPLSAERESMPIRYDETGETMTISFNLAGIDLAMPEELMRINSDRPICQLDAENQDGRISIKAMGRRQSRAVVMMMGYSPLFYQLLRSNSTYGIDIFSDPSRLASSGHEESRDVLLLIRYGQKRAGRDMADASAELTILRCNAGMNLGKTTLCYKDGISYINFENAAPADLTAEFFLKNKRLNDTPLGASEMSANEKRMPIPPDAVYALDTKKTVRVYLLPVDMFGEPNEDMAMSIEIRS